MCNVCDTFAQQPATGRKTEKTVRLTYSLGRHGLAPTSRPPIPVNKDMAASFVRSCAIIKREIFFKIKHDDSHWPLRLRIKNPRTKSASWKNLGQHGMIWMKHAWYSIHGRLHDIITAMAPSALECWLMPCWLRATAMTNRGVVLEILTPSRSKHVSLVSTGKLCIMVLKRTQQPPHWEISCR